MATSNAGDYIQSYVTYASSNAGTIEYTAADYSNYITISPVQNQQWNMHVNNWTEVLYDREVSPDEAAARLDNQYWVSHTNGKIIKIVDIIDEYLLNIINMCQRGRDSSGNAVPEWAIAKLPVLITEAERRKLDGYDDGWDK